jgi:hypothetical protein
LPPAIFRRTVPARSRDKGFPVRSSSDQ